MRRHFRTRSIVWYLGCTSIVGTSSIVRHFRAAVIVRYLVNRRHFRCRARWGTSAARSIVGTSSIVAPRLRGLDRGTSAARSIVGTSSSWHLGCTVHRWNLVDRGYLGCAVHRWNLVDRGNLRCAVLVDSVIVGTSAARSIVGTFRCALDRWHVVNRRLPLRARSWALGCTVHR